MRIISSAFAIITVVAIIACEICWLMGGVSADHLLSLLVAIPLFVAIFLGIFLVSLAIQDFFDARSRGYSILQAAAVGFGALTLIGHGVYISTRPPGQPGQCSNCGKLALAWLKACPRCGIEPLKIDESKTMRSKVLGHLSVTVGGILILFFIWVQNRQEQLGSEGKNYPEAIRIQTEAPERFDVTINGIYVGKTPLNITLDALRKIPPSPAGEFRVWEDPDSGTEWRSKRKYYEIIPIPFDGENILTQQARAQTDSMEDSIRDSRYFARFLLRGDTVLIQPRNWNSGSAGYSGSQKHKGTVVASNSYDSFSFPAVEERARFALDALVFSGYKPTPGWKKKVLTDKETGLFQLLNGMAGYSLSKQQRRRYWYIWQYSGGLSTSIPAEMLDAYDDLLSDFYGPRNVRGAIEVVSRHYKDKYGYEPTKFSRFYGSLYSSSTFFPQNQVLRTTAASDPDGLRKMLFSSRYWRYKYILDHMMMVNPLKHTETFYLEQLDNASNVMSFYDIYNPCEILGRIKTPLAVEGLAAKAWEYVRNIEEIESDEKKRADYNKREEGKRIASDLERVLDAIASADRVKLLELVAEANKYDSFRARHRSELSGWTGQFDAVRDSFLKKKEPSTRGYVSAMLYCDQGKTLQFLDEHLAKLDKAELCETLEEFPAPETCKFIITWLSKDPPEREGLDLRIVALANMAVDESRDDLTEFLNGAGVGLKIQFAKALPGNKPEWSLSFLSTLAEDPDEGVRSEVAAQLRKCPIAQTLDTLSILLKDPSSEVSQEAARTKQYFDRIKEFLSAAPSPPKLDFPLIFW